MLYFKKYIIGGVLISCFALYECKTNNAHQDVRRFPDGFLFGTATASYQVEGAWDADGKTENIWDHLTHTEPCAIKDCSNGDIAANSYNFYKRDVEMMRELGLDFYRFSLSWTRILSSSFPDKINEAGVEYYNNLINEMLKYNIEPMVTLYHWDLPQKLQELGGWTNPHIVDWFGDYARTAFNLFGDRVKYWITMNEPREICYQGYGSDTMAPRLNIQGIAEYMCAKNLLVAHARAYHIYDQEFRAIQNGIIGLTISAGYSAPASDSEEDIIAAKDSSLFEWGIYAYPIYSETGDFPPVMKKRIAAKSAEQGFRRSRLPEFSPEEIKYVHGSSDFFGLNHYTSSYVYRNASVESVESPSFYDDLGTGGFILDEWEDSASSWLKVVPWGLYELLKQIKEDYNNPPVYITENGFSTYVGLDDDKRISYYRQYLDAVLDAIDEGCNVQVYTAWSLLDNFEWMQGYSERFGLYEVDYDSPERTRTPRKSAFVYKEIVRTRTLDFSYEPVTNVMTIDEGHYNCNLYSKLNALAAHLNSLYFFSFTFTFYLRFLILLIKQATISECNGTPGVRKSRQFPDGFLFGTATASYQVEGAWDEDGKSENIWDHLTHTNPCAIKDCSSGDIADDSYHQIERDVEMMRELGLDFYRFSLSWSRILPTSFPNEINEAGVAYYNKLINEMLKYNIEPMVTLYHWDLPQKLQELGGWANPHIGDWFGDYARTAFTLFGDRVKYWWGQYAHPIFSENGDFPVIMKERVATKSAAQGFSRSRLPEFTPEEVNYVRGSSDFFGLNHYTSNLVYRNESVSEINESPSLNDDIDAVTYQPSYWEGAASNWLKVAPWGFVKLLRQIKEVYNNPPVYITENGFSTFGGLVDDDRINYYRQYLNALLDAIKTGSNVQAYAAWSLMDNFEWMEGYTERFGLYEVDYRSPERTRTPRKSAFVYKEIIRTRALDWDYEPDTSVMTIDEGH
ncbi:lactase/phlorizin hydrolase-like [Achroia grisella]|uniref:lactase/phlorizin hydrolase-like n=1 Tax=Achroia grisella TaxID=688607 RepID=UPI0027D2C9D7|nr:lactase/phlorizin hydrolase-like [Achroia grisella]